MTTTFKPKNRRIYAGKFGRLMLVHAGETCTVRGKVTYPANQTRSRKEETWVFIRFRNCGLDFLARPVDVEGLEEVRP